MERKQVSESPVISKVCLVPQNSFSDCGNDEYAFSVIFVEKPGVNYGVSLSFSQEFLDVMGKRRKHFKAVYNNEIVEGKVLFQLRTI